MQKIYHELLQLEEQREHAITTISKRQQVVKRYFDKSTTLRYFQKDRLVFLWNKAKKNHIFIQSLKFFGLVCTKLRS
jgi:hypothetical protein